MSLSTSTPGAAASVTGYGGVYPAKVYSTADPSGTGCIQMYIPQIFGTVPVKIWAPPCSFGGVPNVGDIVWCIFQGGDTAYPTYLPPPEPPPAWIAVGSHGAPAFGTNWANFSTGGGGFSHVGFRLVGDMVQLRGLALYSGGSVPTGQIATPIFTLPVGYRPMSAELIGVEMPNMSIYGGVCRLDISATIGTVSATNAWTASVNNPWVNLTAVQFSVS